MCMFACLFVCVHVCGFELVVYHLPGLWELRLRSQLRYRLLCTSKTPPEVCPRGDLTGSVWDLVWFSGAWVPVSLFWI